MSAFLQVDNIANWLDILRDWGERIADRIKALVADGAGAG